ncbi:MAG: DUF177 domain-containing protein [Bacteroidales bacterium]|jgi:uncharacterized metal-binding protein YceD (DUF177 family)|nr:DUF177 domain-containing protein [Bacteroidales bacterium]
MAGSFSIPAAGMKDGHHVYEFEIDKKFFDLFEESEIREGNLVARVEAQKSPALADLNIRITGNVQVCCDRCLEMFYHPVDCENRLLVKFGLEMDDSDPEIITIPRDEFELDLRQYFYEFIHLALPIQRIHPENDKDESTCNPVMIQKLREHLVKENIKTDPSWDELRKLMNDN